MINYERNKQSQKLLAFLSLIDISDYQYNTKNSFKDLKMLLDIRKNMDYVM